MDSHRPIKVIVVDDHSMLRRGLTTVLRTIDNVEIVGSVGSGEAAVQLCDQVQPDLVLMDMKLPGMDGPASTKALRERVPNVVVIILSSYLDAASIQRALNAGAISYLLKDVSADELVSAIKSAMSGRGTMSIGAAQSLAHSNSQPPVMGGDLTDREREVLALMIEGMNNPQIADVLIVSPATIKSHVSSILSKLNSTSRSQAVVYAVRHGLLD